MFHPATGHRPYFVTKPVALWLEKHLDFPNWTAAEIESMPVTHIGEWAEANGVEMDPLYSTEHREGGTPALGEGVPAIKHADLNVFNDAQWTTLRDLLIHESWRARARQRLNSGQK
jgi:hypothetical protein